MFLFKYSVFAQQSSPINIGDFYEGGVVFHQSISSNQLTGYICDIQDLGYTNWGCWNTSTGADGYMIGDGAQNTTTILAGCNELGIAALLCANSNSGGYNDWFLPSPLELHKIYENLAVVDSTSIANGGFSCQLSNYWSSYESASYLAYTCNFGWLGGSRTKQ